MTAARVDLTVGSLKQLPYMMEGSCPWICLGSDRACCVVHWNADI